VTKQDVCPEPGTRVLFAAATAFAERIDKKDKRVHVSGAHRGVVATMDNGFLIIDQKWYSRSIAKTHK
jgi:hypothetical protein